MNTAIMDHEANVFAMELLMPADWLLRDASGLDLADDEGVAKLARKYRVPASTMAYRLGELRADQESPIKPVVYAAAQGSTTKTKDADHG